MELDWTGWLSIAEELEKFIDRHPEYSGTGWTVLYVFLCFVWFLATVLEILLIFEPNSRVVS